MRESRSKLQSNLTAQQAQIKEIQALLVKYNFSDESSLTAFIFLLLFWLDRVNTLCYNYIQPIVFTPFLYVNFCYSNFKGGGKHDDR